jgi:RecJ-like exonuclease
VEFNLINTDNLQVIDRKHIQNLLSENHLQSQGLINEATAKSAVGFLKIEAWIIGEVIHVGNEVKIKLKAVDISSSEVFAASQSPPIVDRQVEVMLQPKNCTDCNGTGTIETKVKCTSCDGKGGSQCTVCNGIGYTLNLINSRRNPCGYCNGKGKNECSVCKGTGQQVVLNTCKKCNGSGKLY